MPYLLLAFYFIFLGGSPYFYQIFPLRVAHHVIVTVLAIWWLTRRARRGIPLTPLNGLLFAVVGLWLISAALSLDPRAAFESLWFPLTHLLIFFVIVDILESGRQKHLFEAVFLLAGVTVITAGYQLAAWFVGLPPLSPSILGWIDVLGSGVWFPLNSPMLHLPLGVSTWLAAFTAALSVLAAGWALTVRRRDYRIVLWGLAGALLIIMLLTNSRGGLIATAAAVFAFVVLRMIANARRLSRRQLLIGGALMSAIVVGAVILVIARSGTIMRLTGDVLRLNLWQTSLRITAEHPIIGVGAGQFGRALRLYRNPQYVDDRLSTAHNFILNTAAENGIIGLVLFLALAGVVIFAWWRRWRRASGGRRASGDRRIRLEAAFAALVGIAAQSLFDTFTNTPMLILIALLAAYCMVEPLSVLDTPRRGQRWVAYAGVALFAVYGVGLLLADRAQAVFIGGLRAHSLDDVRSAVALDPALRLYDLQLHYWAADLARAQGDLDSAVAHYHAALELEPTWDSGWLNLAALELERGNAATALAALEAARRISSHGSASLHWARVAEEYQLADAESIVQAYREGMGSHPPMSAFWGETDLRREALRRMIVSDGDPLDWRFQVAYTFAPELIPPLLADVPVTDGEWWMAGESARLIDHDPAAALEAFDRAIALNPTNGDYYVSRARVQPDPVLAERDLNVARLLGTWTSYPNAVAAEGVESPEERRAFQLAALPPRIQDQNFEGVLYGGRVGSFDVYPEMRPLGPGTAAVQPLYDLAADFTAQGEFDRAAAVYGMILDLAPEEEAARSLAAHLEESRAP